MRRRISPGLALGVIAVVLGLTGSAAAGSLITSAKIKDGTIQGRDIRKGTIASDKLSAGLRRQLAKTTTIASKGEKGDKGDPGAPGATLQGSPPQKGEKGDKGLDSDQPRAVTADSLRGFTPAPKGDNGDAGVNGIVDFATPPVAPTLGTKALHFKSDTGRPVVMYAPLPAGYDANGPRPLLAELTKASYGSLIHSQPQNALDVSFQFEVVKSKATHFPSGYTTVVYEPYQNGASETLDEWHRHSVDTGLVWSTQALPSGNCTQAVPCPFSQFVSENPQAEVLTAKLRIGQNSGQGWSGFEGYVDDVDFGFGPVVRYDFGG